MKLPYPMRPLRWVGSSWKDFKSLPDPVQDSFGFRLFLAQTGQHPPGAKTLKGIGAGVLELVERFDTDTYRAVYAARFDDAVFVLHAFQKKSKSRIKTPQADLTLIRSRLKLAETEHAALKEAERWPKKK